MNTTAVYSFTVETLEDQATTIKNIVIEVMFSKGMINQEDYHELLNNYAVIVKKPSFFGNIWNEFLKKTGDKVSYILVKQQSLVPDENEEDEPPNLKVVKIDKDKDKK